MTDDTHAYIRASLLLICAIVLLLASGYGHAGDFASFYTAGSQILKRLSPYQANLYKQYGAYGMSSLPLALELVCPACLLPLSMALPVWDIFCLILWTASLYLWSENTWGFALDFPKFARLCFACLIAPLALAFVTHQVIVAVLFFAACAFWATRRRYSGWAGFAAGLMLMKPHLTLLLAIAFYFKNNRKILFTSAMTVAVLLPYVPFMNTYRPISDLSAWSHTIRRQQTEVYFLDEQGVANGIATFFPFVTRAQANDSSTPGILIPKSKGQFITIVKTLAYFVGSAMWISWWWFSNKRWSDPFLYASALACGLLLSPYSHFYDGVMLTPLVLLVFYKLDPSAELTRLLPIFVTFNFAILTLFCLTIRFSVYPWPFLGWISVIYCVFCLSIYTLLYNESRIRYILRGDRSFC